jgi:aryl-alcohol dehydrogenase-like predicted oxidoreductase
VEYRPLGRTDIEVSTVCCGTMAMCPHKTYPGQDDQAAIGAIHAALDAGINFFDTAEAYGDGYAENILGRGLEGRRDEAIIATKVSSNHLREADMRACCEASLRRLRTDYIDLYQVHWPNHDIPFEETAAVLEALKDEGKIRHWGVSNFGKRDLAEAIEVQRPEANQVPYSLLWRVVEHDIVPVCVEHDVSVICYSPMAQGILTGKFEGPEDVPAARKRARYCREEVIDLAFDVVDELRTVSEEIGEPMSAVALAWVLAQGGVTSVIAGARNAEQIAQNARAGDVALPPDAVEKLTRVSGLLKDALDTNPDMWNEGEESRYR